MEYSCCLLIVSFVSMQLFSTHSRADPTIPTLPNFFSGYTESITGSGPSVNMSRSYYDVEMNLARLDVAGETVDLNSFGTVSFIQDVEVGIMYTINRQYNNCTTSSLVPAPDLYPGQDSHYHLRSVSDLFLLSAVEYSYAGNMSAHGLMLDNWVFSGAFSHGGYNYTSSKLQWSITQPGQAISSISSINTSPIPWRLSIDGLVTPTFPDGASTMNVSSVTRYFDLTFEEPSFDVFDTSVCVDPSDAVFLNLAVPIMENGTDLSRFRGNIRKAISNYTQIYPIQVGNIEITSKNGTFIFISLQISNLTSLANITNRKTALEVYRTILNNSVDGQAPFQIEISSGYVVTPYVFVPDGTKNCNDVTSSNEFTVSPSDSITTSTPSVIITTTITITSTASCSAMPTQSPTASTTCSPNTPSPVGVAQSRVVGIAFGTLITGSVVSCVSMVMCFLCYQKTRTRMWSPSTIGYQKQPDTVPEREYFQ